MTDKSGRATEEQIAYAKLLDISMKIGLAMLLVTFAIYVFGIMKPNVPLDQVSDYWGKSASEYVESTGGHHGWGWVGSLDQSDFLNFIGIAFLSAVTIVCYARVLPILIRKKDIVFTIFALVEIAVLVLAASGLLKSGGY